MKSFQSNLGGTRAHRQFKHSLTSFVLILLSQPDTCWILAVQASANNVAVGIGQGVMPVQVFLRLRAWPHSSHRASAIIGFCGPSLSARVPQPRGWGSRARGLRRVE